MNPEPTDSAPARAPVLLVDDSQANLTALEAVLGGRGYELVSVSSGAEALVHLAAREHAVVLLDLQMPIMDGMNTAVEMRRLAAARGRPVPIIFLTATHSADPRIPRAYASGAVDFLQKPLEPEILRSKVQVFADLYLARQRLVAEVEQRRRLQEALSARDQMLAIVSHDLRNPLNAVLLGMTHIERAAEEQAWARARKAVGAITRAVDRMSRLVGDLLDLSTIDAGQPLSMTLGRHDLAELAVEITELLDPLARANQLSLQAVVPRGTHVLCDPDRVQQVLANLVGNAIKFSRRGGSIDVGVIREDDEVVVWVRDSGIGMPAGHVARIFEPYWKGDAGRRDGAGLGLAIARAIVEAHGGCIWVQTVEGRGSTFSFTLRAAKKVAPAVGSSPVDQQAVAPERSLLRHERAW